MAKRTSKLEKTRLRCRRKFLRFFPQGFYDEKYIDWEREYKWRAHLEFERTLNKNKFSQLLSAEKYDEICKQAVTIETKTNLLFSFEKMALRDAVKGRGARIFAENLFKYIYGEDSLQKRFEKFSEMLAILPRKQTRVRTWPLQTVFGFIGNPNEFIFLKPRVTQKAAEAYDYDFLYESSLNWNTYLSLLDFAHVIKKEIADLKPRDMIDLQSFIWVLGSEEYD